MYDKITQGKKHTKKFKKLMLPLGSLKCFCHITIESLSLSALPQPATQMNIHCYTRSHAFSSETDHYNKNADKYIYTCVWLE